jgi:hypothetical protein
VQIVFMLIGALRSMTKTTTAMSLCSVGCSCGKTASRLMQPPCRKGPNSRCAIDTSHHRVCRDRAGPKVTGRKLTTPHDASR